MVISDNMTIQNFILVTCPGVDFFFFWVVLIKCNQIFCLCHMTTVDVLWIKNLGSQHFWGEEYKGLTVYCNFRIQIRK